MKAWLQTHEGTVAEFRQALERPKEAQELILLRYLEANAGTRFGQDHGFASIKTAAEFRKAVPVRSYRDFEPMIREIAAGEKNVLTAEPVFAFEETSGSSGASKLIPYTANLQREFERSVVCWFSSIARKQPEALEGKSYWSLSPPTKAKWRTKGGVPVGFEHDLAYFPEKTAMALAGSMAIQLPPEVMQDSDLFWAETVERLLACEELSLVSVWSPVFALKLDEHLRQKVGNEVTWKELWPRLTLMSCWADAQSAAWIALLQSRLGDVTIEGKGLLSTEGVVSIPWQSGSVLAVTTHFFEFLGEDGTAYFAHELEEGARYEVILTNGAGLYRYRTHDIVLVTGFEGLTPTLSFVGRSGRVSDLVGEKVSEAQANTALQTANGRCRFLIATKGGYLAAFDEETFICNEIEAELRKNPYYVQAIKLGQLTPMRSILISAHELPKLLEYFHLRQGCTLGDVKIPGLVLEDEWLELQTRITWELV